MMKNELKTCEKYPGHVWIADIPFCPYCNISPEARIFYDKRRINNKDSAARYKERTRDKRLKCASKSRKINYKKIANNDGSLINLRFGRLKVIDQKNDRYICLCDCGNYKAIVKQSLIGGFTKSCGCFNKEESKKRNTKINESEYSQILKMFSAGKTLQSIGDKHNVTRERIRQIVLRSFGLSRRSKENHNK